MKFHTPTVLALTSPSFADAYSFGPLFSNAIPFRVVTRPSRASFGNANTMGLITTGGIISDIEEASQQMRDAFRQHRSGYQMIDNGEKFQISLDVPGVKASDIQVNLEEDGTVLSLAGSRSIAGDGRNYSSTFSRKFYLDPSIDTNKITANLQNGVLTVSAPKDLKKIEQPIKSIPIMETSKNSENSEHSKNSETLEKFEKSGAQMEEIVSESVSDTPKVGISVKHLEASTEGDEDTINLDEEKE